MYLKENEDIAHSRKYINSTEVKIGLSKHESQTCDRYVKIEKLTIAVYNLKSNESPGKNGITTLL